jgi:WG containing repeat
MQDLFHVIKNGKSGYINHKGEIVIDIEFEGASSFSEGLARIFIDGKVGFIDMNGSVVIKPIFDNAMGFSEGKAVVTVKGEQGYIDKNGDFIIEPQFYRCNDFENGLANIMSDIYSTGCFIDEKGNIILKGRNFMVSKYSEGLINCPDDGMWGYIDINGNFLIPPQYSYAREFAEGVAAVNPKKANKKKKYGFINKQNEMIIEPKFDGSDIKFSEGFCAVWDDGYGYINKYGELVIPYDFDLGQHFSDGLAVVKPKKNKDRYGYINTYGEVIIQPKFRLAESFINGLASVTIGEKYEDFKYGYIDKTGNYIWEPTR